MKFHLDELFAINRSRRILRAWKYRLGNVRTNFLPKNSLAISYPTMPHPVSFRYFKTSPEIIQLAVMLYVRFPLSLRNVEDLLHERGVDVSYESVRYWCTGLA